VPGHDGDDCRKQSQEDKQAVSTAR
jgi:hypothetical protein